MRLKKRIMVSLALMAALIFTCTAYGDDMAVSSTQLIENAKALDKTIVTYKGETIGDILPREGFAWVGVSDGASTISVYAAKEYTANITHVGRYDETGDTVIATGVFNRACAEHGGDMDIHAGRLSIVAPGGPRQHGFTALLPIATGALAVVAAAIIAIVIKKHRA